MSSSFSLIVKKEIVNIISPRHCQMAELLAIKDNTGKSKNQLARQRHKKLLESCDTKAQSPRHAMKDCCKKAYIRGAYIANGTMVNPQRAYHLEFYINPDYLMEITDIFAFFDLTPKIYKRKSGQTIYFKEAEQIATILSIMGAHIALMEFENCRVNKDVNNSINRSANAAAANVDKVIVASAKHIKDILDIQKMAGGLSVLDSNLAQVAHARIKNPLISLEDIGKSLTPPISKSGVNHRLRKIAKIAESYRNETGGK